MSFVVHCDLREYFGFRGGRAFAATGIPEEGPRQFLLFDAFYACLLLGLARETLGKEEVLEGDPFVVGYPEDFRQSREFIAGLIVETELRRLDTEYYSERDFEREIAKLLDLNEPTRLSNSTGITCANLYAAGGFEYMRDALQPKPTSVEDFLLRYHDLWSNDARPE